MRKDTRGRVGLGSSSFIPDQVKCPVICKGRGINNQKLNYGEVKVKKLEIGLFHNLEIAEDDVKAFSGI